MSVKVGLFIEMSYQAYESSVLQSLNEYAREKDVTLMIFGIYPIHESHVFHIQGQKSIIAMPNYDELDGIILAGDSIIVPEFQKEIEETIKAKANCPVVTIRSGSSDFNSVIIDNDECIYNMTKHFIDVHNLKDISFVTGKMNAIDARERFAGFKRAMKEAGLPVEDKNVFYGDYWREKGKQIVDHFIGSRNGAYPEAIICANDYMAVSVLEELAKRNIKVPEEIKVSGFDNISESMMRRPSLSTIATPSDVLSKGALDIILGKIKGEEVPKIKYVPGHNCYRQSCGCCLDEVEFNEETYIAEVEKYKSVALSCNYMAIDYESILNDKDWISWSSDYIGAVDVKKAFVCLKDRSVEEETSISSPYAPIMRLRLAMTVPGECKGVDIPFDPSTYLPKEYMSELDDGINLFLPLHYKEEVYGYFIFQLAESSPNCINAKTEFLCMNMAIALKRIYMYQDIFSMNDVMRMYLKDPLTDIFNRRGFDNRYGDIKEIAEDKKIDMLVVCIDMDGLKYINDNFGHAEGDDALQRISKALSKAVTKQECCARVGGDEFRALLMIETEGREERFLQDFRNELDHQNELLGAEYKVDASIGTYKLHPSGSLEKALLEADKIMYENKRKKKGEVR